MTVELEMDLERLRASAPAGLAPSVLARTGLADAYAEVGSPLGPVFVAWNRRGVSAARRVDGAGSFPEWFRASFGREAVPAPMPPRLAAAVDAELRGERHPALEFDLESLGRFQAQVLRKTLEIPRGQVRPYGWVAREIGSPAAVRAVGTALARNPIPLLIPCHRVVRGDGTIGNYGAGGPAAKRSILEFEGLDVAGILDAGLRYVGSDSTRIFCLPSCSAARRISDAHRVRFRSIAEAEAARYRPCLKCRPA